MRSIRIVVLLVSMSVMVLWAKAQTNLAFYSLENQFNSSNFNPAFLISQNNFSFSIFPMGGTSIGYNNQQVIKQLVLKVLSGISTDQDYKDMLKSMADHNFIHQNIESALLNIIFRSKVGVFNFRIKEVESFSAAFKGDLSDFIFKDGIQSAVINQSQNMPAQFIHYREYSLGYSLTTRNNKFFAGIRPKIYFGKSAFFSGISGIIIPDQAGEYVLNTGGKVKLSFPLNAMNVNGQNTDVNSGFKGSKAISYLMNSGNPGIGVDLGINYRINPGLTLSMSVIDLGKIYWNKNLNSKSFNGQHNFKGSVYPGYNKAGDEIITKTDGSYSFIDTISTKLDLKIDSSAFSRPMPITVFTGLKYQINPSLKISIVDRYIILKNLNYNSFSILANFDINKKLSVSSGYSIIGNSYKNIPLALLFKRDFGQIYVGTDNLLAFVLPSISDFAGFSFGTCFYLFKNRNLAHTDSKGYPFYSSKKSKKSKKTGRIRKNYQEF